MENKKIRTQKRDISEKKNGAHGIQSRVTVINFLVLLAMIAVLKMSDCLFVGAVLEFSF